MLTSVGTHFLFLGDVVLLTDENLRKEKTAKILILLFFSVLVLSFVVMFAIENSITDDLISCTYEISETIFDTKEKSETVWIPQSGKKYHSRASCSNMKNPSEVSIEYAISLGYTACSKCY